MVAVSSREPPKHPCRTCGARKFWHSKGSDLWRCDTCAPPEVVFENRRLPKGIGYAIVPAGGG